MDSQLQMVSLEERPGIFMIGSSNVGKRTLLSRLLSVDFEDACDSSSEVLAHGWTINTKYYTADVSVWMAHLYDGFSMETLPIYNRLAALVMVFDMTDLSSFIALQDWVSHTDIGKFDILLCIGNKVDLLSDHAAHAEYRRRLERVKGDCYEELTKYGISKTESSSLLGGDVGASCEIKSGTCLEWCSQHSIEYIEACASNSDFDKCLSADGDSQGVERLYSALSAHMWPGMILKSGNKITKPSLPESEELSEEESEYEFEYEVLSAGLVEPWGEDTFEKWVSAEGEAFRSLDTGGLNGKSIEMEKRDGENGILVKQELDASTSRSTSQLVPEEISTNMSVSKGPFEIEDLEQLMSEIGNTRDSLRLMLDFQRREMAATLAMKMAAMFGGISCDDEQEGFDDS